MRASLFFKIYLTLLASLAVVAIVSGLFVRFGQDEEDRSWQGRFDTFMTALVPAGANLDETRAVLTRLADAFDTDIGLYDRDGRPIVLVGRPPRPDNTPFWRGRRHREEDRGFAFQLSDGRIVTARIERPVGPFGRNPLAYMALIAAIIGLASYPVVRHLTRRLETLRRGVETWGESDRLARVNLGGNDEVAAVAASFNEAADRIEALIASHRALLANASHELRSPLARLRMAIDLFEKAPGDAIKQEIVLNLTELDELVGEILLASRLDHAEQLDRNEEFDLLALATEEGARSGVKVDGTEALVRGDPRLVARLVRNLIVNAQRHGAPPVTVSVAAEAANAVLRVSDKGAGISEADRSRIFEAFYRPSGRGEDAGGWGLGLSLVRQIARRHGGDVHYEAPPGGGSVFVVSFPAA
ncbi:MAG: HAMP domain-containing histidine kinase [Rhizobiaceae bacterium]|nr:HAMP domain-containing histidine kinase [Rhizobiaceae bacterium]